jgi:DNA-directed RNA polymerase subunit E'/Rpb7
MFYVITLDRQVDVEPRMFGPQLETSVKEKVRREVRRDRTLMAGHIAIYPRQGGLEKLICCVVGTGNR